MATYQPDPNDSFFTQLIWNFHLLTKSNPLYYYLIIVFFFIFVFFGKFILNFLIPRLFKAIQKCLINRRKLPKQNTSSHRHLESTEGNPTELNSSRQSIPSCFLIFLFDKIPSPEELKTRYHELAMQYHPDRIMVSGESKASAENKMKILNAAYNECLEYYDNAKK